MHLERVVDRSQKKKFGRKKFLDSDDGCIADTQRAVKGEGNFSSIPIFPIFSDFHSAEKNCESPLVKSFLVGEHVSLQLLVVAHDFSSISILA
ncbi:MAG: hypothetical protein V1716_03505 [Candidatus Uhrbacteria bacterium]